MNKKNSRLAIFLLLFLLIGGFGIRYGLFSGSTWKAWMSGSALASLFKSSSWQSLLKNEFWAELFGQGRDVSLPPKNPVRPLLVQTKKTPAPLKNSTPAPQLSKRSTSKAALPVAPETPPPITLHKELIPKNIEIVRVYYAQELTGPGSIVEFDINGSGFNAEFEKMITAESGSPRVDVKNLQLMTPNQIHGVLVVKSDAPTGAVFPQVSIQGKVVFRAPEPFAVIRPGEVLNLIFVEMGENGRSGRFRVFTNLTEDMFAHFSVTSNTDSIKIGNLQPKLPFIVDGIINIGAAPEGSYDIVVKIAEQIIWNRPGIIRVIQPNVGQSGLVQQIRAIDGFHRPGDQAKFLVQGSGFQPNDVNLLTVGVDNFSVLISSMVVRSPGRMEITVAIPMDAKEGPYKLHIFQGSHELLAQDNAFMVVGRNWIRSIQVEPPIKPGQTGTLKLVGRDLDKNFVDHIRVELDTEELKIGSFSWVNPELATANISAGATLLPGDYWVKMTSEGTAVTPQFGSIIRVEK